MLDEGVQIMRQLWTEGKATLAGKHYQVDGAICRPLPLQDGGIPLWIAGSGEKKTLRTAAKYASYTNFAGTPDEFRHKSEVLAGHCADVGTEFDAIVRSANYNVVVGETEKEVQDQLARLRALRAVRLRRRPRVVEGHQRPQSAGRHAGAAHRAADQDPGARHDLRDLVLPRARQGPRRAGAVHP